MSLTILTTHLDEGEKHILMHDYQKKRKEQGMWDNLLHHPVTCFDWNHSEDNQLYFMYRSEECRLFVFREESTDSSERKVPEQHEETAGLRVNTPGAAEQLYEAVRADAKYPLCDRRAATDR